MTTDSSTVAYFPMEIALDPSMPTYSGGLGVSAGDTFEVASLYDKLEMIILPMFDSRPIAYGEVMRSAIAINGSFFNTQRMLAQYLSNAHFQEVKS